ncbi:MAG TPA: alpha/beta hydrolase [Gallionella sp.]|jgi:pimeloyl-ACP methyl ester carboxylesterase|nr:alpha/beta hydrolase [Gallionella sp.]
MSHQAMRRIGALAILLMVAYASVRIYDIWSNQRDSIFEPEVTLQTNPARLGAPFEELRIPSGSGAERGDLHAWWIPAETTNAPTLLYLHGNFRNIGYNLENALRYRALCCNLLLVDYRGYGNSTGGKPSEAKVYEDAEAAWQYLLKRRGVESQQLFIYGHSLGGAVAIDLALHHPEAAGLIVESTFTSMQAMSELKYDFLPVGLLLNQRFESLQKIPQLKIPLLLIHGTWDQKVPVEMGRQLFEAAPQPRTLVLIDGGEHSNNAAVGWIEYRDAVSAFVSKYSYRELTPTPGSMEKI